MAKLAAGGDREPPWQRWLSPAKLNLGLRILGRRADGYHLLQTVFQLIDLSDVIHLRVRMDGQIRRVSALPGVNAADDLAVRAATALQKHAGCRLGVDLHVSKHIPMGAGLGGGSSNAGTVLRALNRLWQLHLASAELAQIGAPLGADVAVFAHGCCAVGEGVGDLITPIKLPDRRFLVVCAPVHVPTASIFSDQRLTRDSLPSTIAGLLSDERWGNDCETVVTERFPDVAAVLAWMRAEGPAQVTGTGAAVYAQIAELAIAEARLARLPLAWHGWSVNSIDTAPEGADDISFTGGASPSW